MDTKLQFIFFSGFNFFFSFSLLGIAGYFVVNGLLSEHYLVLLGFLLSSQQVGQTVGLQLSVGRIHVSLRNVNRFLVVAIVLVSVLTSIFQYFAGWPDMADGVLISILAVALGLFFGVDGARILLQRGSLNFQRYNFVRNLMVCLLLILSVYMFGDNPYGLGFSLILILCILVLITRLKKFSYHSHVKSLTIDTSGLLGKEDRALIKSAIIGIGCSLLYRNDVNLVRIAFEGDVRFVYYHYVFLVYSGLVGVVGFFVSNYLYPSIHHSPEFVFIRIKKFIYPLYIIVIFILCISSAFYLKVLTLFLIFFVAAINPFLSAFLHVFGKSIYVYLAGAFCFLMVLFVPFQMSQENSDLLRLFSLYNCLVFFLLLFKFNKLQKVVKTGYVKTT